MQTQLTLDIGKSSANWICIHYCRGTNSNESIIRSVERVLPTSGKAAYISTFIRMYMGSHNLCGGDWPHVGCWGPLLTHQVWCLCRFCRYT